MTLELSAIGAITAFAAGAVSFLSPCVLPLVPAYISYVVGQGVTDERGEVTRPINRQMAALLSSVVFVLGFTTIFVVLGAGVSALSAVLSAYRYEINIVSGVMVILFGLFMTGLWRPGWMERDTRMELREVGRGPVSAYLMGMAFAFGWSPCIGPILGAILGIAASSGRSSSGIALLAIYSLGLGLPFVLTAVFFNEISTRLKKFRHAGRFLQVVAGFMMVAMGVVMITGYMTEIAIWFIETFPMLGQIG